MNMTSKSDCIGVTCTRLRHFADTFSQWKSCWKIKTLGHMAENKCGYQMHIFVTSLSSQHAPVWRCFCMVQPLRQPFRPKCTNRILQMHHQKPRCTTRIRRSPTESCLHLQREFAMSCCFPPQTFPELKFYQKNYNGVIMGAMASEITRLTIVYSTVYSGTDQRKHQSSASLAIVLGIHRWPVNSPHKWPVTRKIFPLDDVIMISLASFCNFVRYTAVILPAIPGSCRKSPTIRQIQWMLWTNEILRDLSFKMGLLPVCRFYCENSRLWERSFRSLGCRWTSRDPTIVETVLPEYTR